MKSPGIVGVAIVRVPPTWLGSASAPAPTQSLPAMVVKVCGAAPTENGLPVTFPFRASICAIVPSNSSATQIVSVVAASDTGPSPTVRVDTLLVTGSIRDTDCDSELATQTLPPATRMPRGPEPTRTPAEASLP